MEGRPSPKTSLLFAGASTPQKHRRILDKRGTKSMHIFIKVGGIKEKKIKLLKHVFVLCSLPVILSKIFSLATLTRLRFILHLEMQARNVLYQPQLYFFLILVSLSLTASFQNPLKTRIKLHKIAYKMSRNCWGGVEEKWGETWEWGERAPWLLGGDRSPCPHPTQSICPIADINFKK